MRPSPTKTALPSEGPSIRPHKGAGRYFVGDPVELLCSAPESKPAAKLDWILDGSWNLSAAPDHWPLIEVRNQRLVRLPSLNTSAQRSLARPLSWSSSPVAYTVYQLDNGTRAVPLEGGPPEGAPPRLPVELAGALDQLAEMSSSRLNFTVGPELLQVLASHRAKPPAASLGGKSPQLQQQLEVGRGRLLGAPRGDLSARMPLKGHPSTAGDKHNLTPLRIRCVARVLHLTMSDEIKLRLANRPPSVADLGPNNLSAQRQTNTNEARNSGECSVATG